MSVEGSTTDPKRLEGRKEESQPRDFFWDSITLYIVGIILALAAIDVLTEFIRGSTVSCLVSSSASRNDKEVSEDFVNSYCSSSIPRAEFYPAFLVIHGILIAIPHYLWANHYGGNFEFFFSLVREMDRIRNEDTGDYSEKNHIILQQLTEAFTTYKQNWMFNLYVFKLILQLFITIAGFVVALAFFTDFSEVFPCPSNFNASGGLSDPFWPLYDEIPCVFTSMRLFASIRIADTILLSLLILSFTWSLIWCGSTHPTELGTRKIALFCFQSAVSPNHYVPKFPLTFCCNPFKRICSFFFTSIPFCGSGPHITTNLNFLVLKLFRTDSGLGFVFREMQVLQKVKKYNDDDQRRATLHRTQQEIKKYEDGDLITTDDVQGYCSDLKWKFTKKAGEDGLYDTMATPLQSTDTLVLPNFLRGVVLGFSSLTSGRKRAVFVTFGSVSLGIPSALSRVFSQTAVLNFNPYFKKQGENDNFFIANQYCSKITEIVYPEDILSAKYEASNDFGIGLNKLWSRSVQSIDFMVIGPVENKLHLSTVSLCLSKMVDGSRFNSNSILLTMYPIEISSKPTDSEFYPSVPLGKYFEKCNQRVYLNTLRNYEFLWPPVKPPNDQILKATNGHIYSYKLLCGDSESVFEFGLYKYSNQV